MGRIIGRKISLKGTMRKAINISILYNHTNYITQVCEIIYRSYFRKSKFIQAVLQIADNFSFGKLIVLFEIRMKAEMRKDPFEFILIQGLALKITPVTTLILIVMGAVKSIIGFFIKIR